jgi:hypothetical protein
VLTEVDSLPQPARDRMTVPVVNARTTRDPARSVLLQHDIALLELRAAEPMRRTSTLFVRSAVDDAPERLFVSMTASPLMPLYVRDLLKCRGANAALRRARGS